MHSIKAMMLKSNRISFASSCSNLIIAQCHAATDKTDADNKITMSATHKRVALTVTAIKRKWTQTTSTIKKTASKQESPHHCTPKWQLHNTTPCRRQWTQPQINSNNPNQKQMIHKQQYWRTACKARVATWEWEQWLTTRRTTRSTNNNMKNWTTCHTLHHRHSY